MLASIAASSLIAASVAAAAQGTPEPDRIAIGAQPFRIISDTEIVIDGVTYDS